MNDGKPHIWVQRVLYRNGEPELDTDRMEPIPGVGAFADEKPDGSVLYRESPDKEWVRIDHAERKTLDSALDDLAIEYLQEQVDHERALRT